MIELRCCYLGSHWPGRAQGVAPEALKALKSTDGPLDYPSDLREAVAV
jgi:hypothetical protein